jgi:hypothetical protein
LDRWYQFGAGALFFLVTEVKSSPLFGSSQRFRFVVTSQLTFTLVLVVVFALLRQMSGEDIGHPSSRMQAFTLIVFIGLLFGVAPF